MKRPPSTSSARSRYVCRRCASTGFDIAALKYCSGTAQPALVDGPGHHAAEQATHRPDIGLRGRLAVGARSARRVQAGTEVLTHDVDTATGARTGGTYRAASLAVSARKLPDQPTNNPCNSVSSALDRGSATSSGVAFRGPTSGWRDSLRRDQHANRFQKTGSGSVRPSP